MQKKVLSRFFDLRQIRPWQTNRIFVMDGSLLHHVALLHREAEAGTAVSAADRASVCLPLALSPFLKTAPVCQTISVRQTGAVWLYSYLNGTAQAK